MLRRLYLGLQLGFIKLDLSLKDLDSSYQILCMSIIGDHIFIGTTHVVIWIVVHILLLVHLFMKDNINKIINKNVKRLYDDWAM